MDGFNSTSPTLQRTILRLVQASGTMERSALGLRSRSYDPENWGAVLDDLIDRGLITEGAVIRVGEKSMRNQKRAVIVYQLGDVFSYPDFEKMSNDEVHTFVATFPRRDSITDAVSA